MDDRRIPDEEIARRAGGGAVGLALRYGLGFLLNVLGLWVVVPALGEQSFGTRFTLPLLVIYGFDLMSKGVWGTLVQRAEEPDRRLLHTGFTLQLLVGLVLGVLVYGIGAPLLANQYRDDVLMWLLPVASIGGLLTMLRWYLSALAERQLRYREVGLAELIELGTFNLVLIVGVLAGRPLLAIALAMGTRGLLSGAYLAARLPGSLGLALDRDALEVYRGFGLPFVGFSLLKFVPVHAAPAVASFTLAPPQAAIIFSVHSFAYRILELPRVLVTIAYRLGLTVQSRLAGDDDAFDRSMRAGVRVLLVLLAPALTALALLAPIYVPLFDDDFAPAARVMPWLAVPFLLNAAWMYLSTALSAQGRPGWVFGYYALYNVVLWSGVGLFMRWNPLFGLPAAELVASAFGFVLLSRVCARPDATLRWRDVVEPVGAAALTLAFGAGLGRVAGPLLLVALGAMALFWVVRYRSLGSGVVAFMLPSGRLPRDR